MAGYLEDLDELVLKCRNKSAREYIRESVACYRAEAYRSAIVSCWVAVCYDLIEKLRELALAGDKQAEKKIEELDEIHRSNDTSRSLKFERDILDFARDKLQLISALEHDDLDRILKDRHRCAHPSLNAEGAQYAPPAELARLHIHSAVTHLLRHEPAQGKFALDRVLSQLSSEYFPSKNEDVLKALQNSPIRRARPSLVRNFIAVLIKNLFLDEQKDYTTSSKLAASLHAVCHMHRALYEESCAQILPEVVSRVTDEDLDHVTARLPKFPMAWECLGETQQRRMQEYVARLPSKDFSIIDEILSYSPLRNTALRRVRRASLKDLDSVFPFFAVPSEIIDRSIELYHDAKSFDDANKIAFQIKLFASDFSEEHIRMLLSKVSQNAQITGSFELPNLLESIRNTASAKSLDFDDLLREYGLPEHREGLSDGEGNIPF